MSPSTMRGVAWLVLTLALTCLIGGCAPDSSAISEGRTQADKGNWPQALAAFDKAVQLDPQDPWAYYDRAAAYFNLGKQDEAIKDYQAVLQLGQANPDLKFYWGQVYGGEGAAYFRKGDYDQALSLLNRALAIAEVGHTHDSAQTLAHDYQFRGIIYYTLKDYDKSWADVNKVKELGFASDLDKDFLDRLQKDSGRTQ